MMFFRPNPLKKEESVGSCASLQVLGAPACAALSRSHPAQCADPVHSRGFGHLNCWGFFYKKTPLFITSAIRQKGCLQENFLLL